MTAPSPVAGIEALEVLLAGARLPWAYRPNEHDDWGFIRAPVDTNGWRPVVAISKSDNLSVDASVHRLNRTDPYEPVGRLITAAVNAIPALLAASRERDALRAALEAIDAMPGYVEPVMPGLVSGLARRYNKALDIARAALAATEPQP